MNKDLKEISKHLQDAKEFINEAALELLSDYIDEAYPKGIAKDRGAAITHIVFYISWLKKQLKDTPNQS